MWLNADCNHRRDSDERGAARDNADKRRQEKDDDQQNEFRCRHIEIVSRVFGVTRLVISNLVDEEVVNCIQGISIRRYDANSSACW